MDTFGRIIAVLLATVLIFLFPLRYLAINQEAVLENHVHSETAKFTEDIMQQGYLTLEAYTNYLNKLGSASPLYEIQLIHSKPQISYGMGGKVSPGFDENITQTSVSQTSVNQPYLYKTKENLINPQDTNPQDNNQEDNYQEDNNQQDNNQQDTNSQVSVKKNNNCFSFLGVSNNKKVNNTLEHESSNILLPTDTKVYNIMAATIPKELPVGLTVTPSSDTVFNGSEPAYTVEVSYDDNTNKIVTSGYTKTGFTTGAGTKLVKFDYSENGKIVSASVTIVVNRNTKVCDNGHTYELDDFDTDLGCPVCVTVIDSISAAPKYITVKKGTTLDIAVTVTYLDGHTKVITSGWTSNFNSNQLGNQKVTVFYEGKSTYVNVTVIGESITCNICSTVYDANPDGSDPGCPACRTSVINITASPDIQTVPIGENINIEVTAVYGDGHSTVITGWTSNFNSFKTGLQSVTIYYKTVTTTIEVFVESETETTCPICKTVYNPIEYSNGCPVCSKTVKGIEASLRNGSYQLRIGSELNLSVIIIYKDGHREYANTDWSVEGYQLNVLGTQVLTIKYNEFQTTFTLEVVDTLAKTTCINGHVYYLNADGSDPGCPYCSDVENSKSTVESYYDCIYTDTILNELYETGIYHFQPGDYITVTVIPKNKSSIKGLQGLLALPKPLNIQYSFGGQVHGKYI